MKHEATQRQKKTLICMLFPSGPQTPARAKISEEMRRGSHHHLSLLARHPGTDSLMRRDVYLSGVSAWVYTEEKTALKVLTQLLKILFSFYAVFLPNGPTVP